MKQDARLGVRGAAMVLIVAVTLGACGTPQAIGPRVVDSERRRELGRTSVVAWQKDTALFIRVSRECHERRVEIVEVVTSDGTKRRDERVQPGAGQPCVVVPAPMMVWLAVTYPTTHLLRQSGPNKIGLGRTDALGRLDASLVRRIPLELVAGIANSAELLTVRVIAAYADADGAYNYPEFIGEEEEGVAKGTSIDLAPVVDHYDAEAWTNLGRPSEEVGDGLAACANPTSTGACSAVRAYLIAFPNGKHMGYASKVIAAAAPKMAALRDEEAWGAANVAHCKKPVTDDACDGVQQYLAEYADGNHAKEGAQALKAAQPKLAAMKKQAVADSKAVKKKNEEDLAAAKKKKAAAEAELAMLQSLSGVTLSNVKLVSVTGLSGGYYVRLFLDVTVKKKWVSGSELWARATCVVGDKKYVDDGTSMSSIDDLDPGETRATVIPMFVLNTLAKSPSECTVKVLKQEGHFGKPFAFDFWSFSIK